jgi:hypothetical protein
MRKCIGMFVGIIALSACAYGRLGETEQELTKRFGPPMSKGNETTLTQGKVVEFGSRLTFRRGDWTIECAIIDGRCARIVYLHPGDWTEDQFTTVLTGNAQGAGWTDISKEMTKKLAREWRRSDAAVAVWHMGTGMSVTNPAYDRAKQKAEARAKADASQIPKI